ncbi:MAG: hypothetical protein HOW73_45760 [Polyangiaceae bacterium]|nr:hypothetical protein [Polyangiaceae bacterium]
MSRPLTTAHVAGVGLVCAVLGYLGASLGHRGEAEQVVPPGSATALSSTASAPPSAPAIIEATAAASTSPAPPDALAAVRAGDLTALKQLELRSPRERTIDEALALEAGYAVRARDAATALVADLEADRTLLEDPSTMLHVYKVAFDARAAPSLLGGMAHIPSPTVADFLYDVATAGDPGASLSILASDLLAGRDVFPRASKGLRIAVDLRAAPDCWKRGEALRRAVDDADERVLPIIALLAETTGCGADKKADCNACLRSPPYDALIEDVRRAAKERPFTPPWRPAKR